MCEELQFVRLACPILSNSIKQLQIQTLEDADEFVDECNCGHIAFHNFIQSYRLARKIKVLTEGIRALHCEFSVSNE